MNDFCKKISNDIIKSQGSKIILTIGCGGSHSIASHLTSELVGTFKNKKRKAYPSISLFSDPSISSAISNDFCFEDLSKRYIESFLGLSLMLVAFTTSGSSPVILNALKYAKEKNLKSYLITGPNKKQSALKYTDFYYLSKFSSTSDIQEDHLKIVHKICENIEL